MSGTNWRRDDIDKIVTTLVEQASVMDKADFDQVESMIFMSLVEIAVVLNDIRHRIGGEGFNDYESKA